MFENLVIQYLTGVWENSESGILMLFGFNKF